MAGLQIADNIAYNGNFSIEQKDLRHFYGIRILPEMFRTIPMERKSLEQIKYYNHMLSAIEIKIKKLELDELKKAEEM